MVNPRIVKGRAGSGVPFGARGRIGNDAFVLGVDEAAVRRFKRLRLEDALVLEARALMDRAEGGGGIDWTALRFTHHPEFDVWEKTLTANELDRLMTA